jgi:hypothetical protein
VDLVGSLVGFHNRGTRHIWWPKLWSNKSHCTLVGLSRTYSYVFSLVLLKDDGLCLEGPCELKKKSFAFLRKIHVLL